jgi:hypothetical protein
MTIVQTTRPRLPVIPYKLGIIKQRFDMVFARSFDVQSGPLMDQPKGRNKGHTYIVPLPWIEYMQKLMTPQAWSWWKRPNMLMVNRRHKYDDLDPPDFDECRFENIMLPCNFIAFDYMTPTHGQVVGRMNTHNTKMLNPKINNWFYEPYLFWKASIHNEKGVIRNVGAGFDVYTPVIRQLPQQWALLEDIELFPKLPFIVEYEGRWEEVTGYCLLGACVLGHTATRDIPLRLCTKPQEVIHPTTWHLNTAPVVPAGF